MIKPDAAETTIDLAQMIREGVERAFWRSVVYDAGEVSEG